MLKSCTSILRDPGCLAEWIRGLEVLGIFWAKRIKSIEVAGGDPVTLVLEWRYTRQRKRAILVSCPRLNSKCLDRGWRRYGYTTILLTMEELPKDSFDMWSKVFIYNTRGDFLEPNSDVTISIYPPDRVSEDVAKSLHAIQKSSWGFYKHPPSMDYVLIANLPSGEAIGSAYYNPLSSNIDYGIHVSKTQWRRRIGTRLLVEAARLAESMGFRWMSVVRVLRGARGSASDRRALAFYRVNRPVSELNVYRLKE